MKKNQPLIIVEAMKMETEIVYRRKNPKKIYVSEGQQSIQSGELRGLSQWNSKKTCIAVNDGNAVFNTLSFDGACSHARE